MQDASDLDAAAMRAIIKAIDAIDLYGRGLTCAAVIDHCKKQNPADAELQAELRAAVEDLCGRLDSRALGYKLRHFKRRNFGGRMLDEAGSTGGSSRWVVRKADGTRQKGKAD